MNTVSSSRPVTGKTKRQTALNSLMRLIFAGAQTTHSLSKTFSSVMAYEIVKGGISSRVLPVLGDYLDLSKTEVACLVDLDRTTAYRKVSEDKALPMHAAESVLRLVELSNLAEDTFETQEAAAGWLRRPHPMLDGETPLALAKSAYGAEKVKEMLVALKYGGAA